MTIINFAFNAERALVVSDEAATSEDGRTPLRTSKVIVLPHLRCIGALTGELLLSVDMDAELRNRTPHGAKLAEQMQELAVTLRLARDHYKFTKSTARAIVIGFGAEDHLSAFALDARDDFEPSRLAPGAYCQPPVLGLATRTAGTWESVEDCIIGACLAQRAQRETPSGGRFHHTRLSRDGITVTWTDALPDVEAKA